MQYRLFTQIFIFLGICISLTWILRSYSQPFLSIEQNITCSKSLRESDNFICESDELWNERKVVYRIQDKANMQQYESQYFFLKTWEPNFHCSLARRIGDMGDGGKWVCDVSRLKTRSDCLIYSVGSNNEFSFETDIKKVLPHCEIHTFDSKLYLCPNNVCEFHNIAFGNGIHPSGSKGWQTVIHELGHTNRLFDILKIDIEGGEYDFFPSLFSSSPHSFPRQILLEVHKLQSSSVQIHELFELLRKNNYVIFNKEVNLLGGPDYFEYAFLKLNYRFFE